MEHVLSTVRQWWDQGHRVALATVVATRRSTPLPAGAVMAINDAGAVIGNISGGCVESDAHRVATQVLEDGIARVVDYGITDDTAWSVGLMCGGELDVVVAIAEPDDPALALLADALAHDRPVVMATRIPDDLALDADLSAVEAHPAPTGAPATAAGQRLTLTADDTAGTLGDAGLDHAVTADALGMLQQGVTAVRRYGASGQRRADEVGVFVASFAPPAAMYVFGAIDFAAALCEVGDLLGYRVTVCDAREVFTTRQRLPAAHEIVVDWPHRFLAQAPIDERSVICVLTHDPKFDVPVLEIALRSPAAYIGAMGSRRTHQDRLERLRQVGLTDHELDRLRSPIGLDLGARTAQETAVSIAAEIIRDRWGGSGLPLGTTQGPIHQR